MNDETANHSFTKMLQKFFYTQNMNLYSFVNY
jgi:hypothetical protein